jgi:hypothetical protein
MGGGPRPAAPRCPGIGAWRPIPMERDARHALFAILGIVLLTGILSLARQAGVFSECESCNGDGVILFEEVDVAAGTRKEVNRFPCDECSLSERFDRMAGAVRDVERYFVPIVVLSIWIGLIVLPVWATKVVDCRCSASPECSACRGRGWLTRIDRWLAERPSR